MEIGPSGDRIRRRLCEMAQARGGRERETPATDRTTMARKLPFSRVFEVRGGRAEEEQPMSDRPESIEVTLDLLRRYDRPGPRYTSYPTAVEFGDGFTEADYRERLALADARPDESLSLYFHLPFCEERCTYCGCHVVITRRRELAEEYLGHLLREVDLLAAALPSRRRVAQYHWGGGTPTYLDTEQIRRLHAHVARHFSFEPEAELAIEVDPRVTSHEQLAVLRELGFNRISMGVQDFTPEVQEAIGRHQSETRTRETFEQCRALGYPSINIDLVYGLPRQEPGSFERNIDTLIGLRPDRIALYSYAHVPWLKPNQKRIDTDALPAPEVKLHLFCIAREKLRAAGYAPIGMDHFALPGDELVAAMHDRRLHRNFMGYTVKNAGDMLGCGISAIGDVQGAFAQNAKKLPHYYDAISAGRFPIEKGYPLSDDDRLRREVILQLMCNLRLERGRVEEQFGIDFAAYFATELAELSAPDGPVEHGFLEITPERLEVRGNGRLFLRNICMVFDRYLRDKRRDKPTFSRTV